MDDGRHENKQTQNERLNLTPDRHEDEREKK